VHFLPWWALVACLAASAVVAYLLLGRTQAGDSRWALFPLTVALAPVVLAGAMAAALVLSTLLSAALDEQPAAPTGPSEPAARTERTGAEATTEGTDLGTTSEPTAPATSSPSASPGASPSASASASAAP
jgi:septal ring-binding cell division protein DamX